MEKGLRNEVRARVFGKHLIPCEAAWQQKITEGFGVELYVLERQLWQWLKARFGGRKQRKETKER